MSIGFSTSLSSNDFTFVPTLLAERPIKAMVRALGLCSSTMYCEYHDRKRNNKAILLPRYVVPSATCSVVISDRYLATAIRAMRAEYRVAGSWQLMGEQREWIDSRLAIKLRDRERRTRMAILGVPGVTHLRETVKLMTRRVAHTAPIDFFIFERCVRPLEDIATFLRGQSFKNVVVPPRELQLRPIASLRAGRLSFHLVQCDLAQECPLTNESVDIVCSHLLFSLLTEFEISGVLKNMAAYLHPSGRFLLAQDAPKHRLFDLNEHLERAGLVAIDIAKSWNLYNLTNSQCDFALRGHAIHVENNVLLMDIQKVDR